MKKTLLPIAILIAASTFSPVLSRADSPESTRDKSVRHKTVYVSQMPKKMLRNVEYIFITNQPVTGSHLPLVIRSYNGVTETSSPLTTYNRETLDQTGAVDIGSQLVRRDPAITFGRHF